MTKRFTCFVLCFALILGSFSFVFADRDIDEYIVIPYDGMNYFFYEDQFVAFKLEHGSSSSFWPNLKKIVNDLEWVKYAQYDFGDYAAYLKKYAYESFQPGKLHLVLQAMASNWPIQALIDTLNGPQYSDITGDPVIDNANDNEIINKESASGGRGTYFTSNPGSGGRGVSLYNVNSSHTFYELLGAFLETCSSNGYGSVISYSDLMFGSFLDGTDGSLPLGYLKDISTNSIFSVFQYLTGYFTGSFDDYFVRLFNDQGYYFEWNSSKSIVTLVKPGVNKFVHKVTGTGNNLAIQGTQQGLETLKYYYTDIINDPELSSVLSNIITSGINNSSLVTELSKIASGSAIASGVFDSNGQLTENFVFNNDNSIGSYVYSPSTQTYIYQTENYSYEITNNYSYTHINYYMPGSDVPFSQKDFYFELPDGRNSMELSRDEINGLVLDFDVVNYDAASTDPYMQSLYHFNGDTYNSALPIGVDADENIVFEGSLGAYQTRTFSFADFNAPVGTTIFIDYNKHNSSSIVLNGGALVSNNTGSTQFILNSNSTLTLYPNSGSFYNIKIYSVSILSSDSILVDGGSLDFSVNPSYTFVSTGLDSYDSALYLDGLSHIFSINSPFYSLTRDVDFSISFRWYQEKSTFTGNHSINIGGSNIFNFNGSKFLNLNGSNINVDIPYGSWNTLTFVRSGSNLLFFVNGLLCCTSSFNSCNTDSVVFSLASDSNVHYFDEYLVTLVPLYTSTHVPRLQPYDPNYALVLPDNLSANSVAIHSQLPVNSFRIGGVRPSFPQIGDVYIYLDGNYISSIQQYNGFGWVDYSGMVYFNGHWYSLENFYFGMVASDFDNNLNVDTNGSSGSGSSSSTNVWDFLGKITDLIGILVNSVNQLIFKLSEGVFGVANTVGGILENLLTGIIDLIGELVETFVGFISQFFTGLFDFLSGVISGVGDISEDISGLGGIFSGVFNVLPSAFIRIFTFALVVLIAISLFHLF